MSTKLSYEGFKNVIVSQAEKKLLKKRGIKRIGVDQIVKNNDTIMDRLDLEREDGQCTPCIYLNDLYDAYEKGCNIEEILKLIEAMYCSFANCNIPGGEELVAMLHDLERVRSLIECRLVNGTTNGRRLEGCPYIRIGEFALYYQIKVGDTAGGFYMAKITDDMLSKWEINLEELHDIAIRNMNMPMNFVLKTMEDIFRMPYQSSIFVLTSRSKVNGATMIISEEVRKKISRYVGGDYYILPSSIHELIIVPKKEAPDAMWMTQTVCAANKTKHVPKDAFLSNTVYEYCAEDGRVLASLTMEELAMNLAA